MPLSEDVYSRIAAGEVIERPSSVVKEAVENAIDAGATEISVSLAEGGKIRIVVEDNGDGISFDELPLAVSRYATSKISTVEELEALMSLGFRGEALASIAAVSRLELRSRRREDEDGGMIRVEGGGTTRHERTSARPGTRVSVEDLFFTLPARRKFMKTTATEARRVFALVRDFAVAYPSISFTCKSDGKTVFSSLGDGDRESLLAGIWGGEGLDSRGGGSLRMCETATTNLKLECWWMPFPGKTRSQVSAFVNGRVVNDSLIKGAAGALARTMTGNWALFFTVPPALLDANIHPAKAEVRFRYPGEVFDAVQQAALILSGRPSSIEPAAAGGYRSEPGGYRPVPGFDRGRPRVPDGSFAQPEDLFNRVASEPFDAASEPELPPSAVEPRAARLPEVGSSGDGARFIGLTSSGYVLLETHDSLVLMDPHAAHERVNYERVRAVSDRNPAVQSCAVPIPLPPSFSMSAREHVEALSGVGFAFEEQGGLLCLSAYPSLQGVMDEDPVRLLRSVLSEWTEDLRISLSDVLWKKLATLACGRSVKLGQDMSSDECLALWRELNDCEQPWTCPHGRPTVMAMPLKKLTSFFGRE
jgi:DNA mismatch repair protein MutL